MSRSAGFTLQLAATTAGAFLDYLIGRLTGAVSLGVASWAALMLVAAAVLEFSKDLARDRSRADQSYTGRTTMIDFLRPVSRYRWATIVRALWAAGFAGAAAYAFTLAVITVRFGTVYNGRPLGKDSPFDQAAITFISNFQASAATAVLVGGAFVLGLLLRSEVLLPCGIGLVAIVNAILIGLPHGGASALARHARIDAAVTRVGSKPLGQRSHTARGAYDDRRCGWAGAGDLHGPA